MATKSNAFSRMFAWFHGEIPATMLEAYRRASLPVFEVMDLAEARRAQCAAEGLSPWTVPPAARAELLCAWNAFVLQTLGNDILDADYEASPATAGYLPSFTAQQVLGFYSQVEEWLTRARQAHANPDFRLDVEVPAALPAWKDSRLQPMPATLVMGVLRAMRSMAEHAGAAMAFLPDQASTPGQQAQLNRIRNVHASAESKARYALDLYGTGAEREVHARLEPYAKAAIELFYELGQLVADPSLAAAPASSPPGQAPSLSPDTPSLPRIAAPAGAAAPSSSPAPPKRAAPAGAVAPGLSAFRRPAPPPAHEPEPGFDVWCLTDPQARARLHDDPQAWRALRKMWERDTDRERTLAIHAEIQAALGRGEIAYASGDGERLGHFHCCPWGPIYVALHAVTLGGRQLGPMQRFVYNVGFAKGRAFRRGILFGTFQETVDLEYDAQR